MTASIYLASRSPRRRELLAQIGVGYLLLDCDIDEAVRAGELPADYVVRMAQEKSQAGWLLSCDGLGLPVLGADTAVVLDGRILGKPRDRDDAAAMLAALSGRKHQVMTGVCLRDQAGCLSRLSLSEVRFAHLEAPMVARYLASGEADDKAGAYGIQGLAAVFITALTGSYSGVVGLPLRETAQLLAAYGLFEDVGNE